VYTIKAYGLEVQLHSFVSSVLCATCLGRFTLPLQKEPRHPFNRRLDWQQYQSTRLEEETYLAPAGNRTHGRQARSYSHWTDWALPAFGDLEDSNPAMVTLESQARISREASLFVRGGFCEFARCCKSVVGLAYFWGSGGSSIVGPVSEWTYATPDGEFSWLYALPEMELNVLERWIFS